MTSVVLCCPRVARCFVGYDPATASVANKHCCEVMRCNPRAETLGAGGKTHSEHSPITSSEAGTQEWSEKTADSHRPCPRSNSSKQNTFCVVQYFIVILYLAEVTVFIESPLLKGNKDKNLLQYANQLAQNINT